MNDTLFTILRNKTEWALEVSSRDISVIDYGKRTFRDIETEMTFICLKSAEKGWYYCKITIPYFVQKYNSHEISVARILKEFAAENYLRIEKPLKDKKYWYFHWDI